MSNTEMRTEYDFIGEKKIPADCYYGVQTARGAENFAITGYRIHPTLIVGMAWVKKAAAKANCQVGLLNPQLADAIVWAADQLIEGNYHDQFIVDPIQGGAGTSINMNTNEVIANLALERMGKEKGDYDLLSPNTHVNMAQSTNDAFPTGGHLAMLTNLTQLLEVLEGLVDSMERKGEEFDSVIKMGRTHLQDAVPIRLGQEFKAYSAVLKRDLRRIAGGMNSLNTINIGATAVGTGLNAELDYMKLAVDYLIEETGFPLELAADLVDGTQNTDVYTEVSSTLKICMINLSKIANDLRLMASGPRAGLGEITLPSRQPGSSIMPGKVNPVMPEVINQIAFQVLGNDHTISLASEAGQFELNVMEPVLFFNLIQSIQIMTNGIRSFNEFCVKGIEANTERMKEYVDRSIGIVTAVNPHIGYAKATLVAREALETGKTVRELCKEHQLLSDEQLDIILEPFEMTEVGISGKELLR